jgi:hypothetical protein
MHQQNGTKEAREWIQSGWPVLMSLLSGAALIAALAVTTRFMDQRLTKLENEGSPAVKLLDYKLSELQSQSQKILSKLEQHMEKSHE